MTNVQDLLPPLTESDVGSALETFASAVSKAYGPRLEGLYLFGSRARGDHRPDSDADIAVVIRGDIADSWREKSRLIDLAIDAIIDTGLQIQPWPFTEAAWHAGSTPLAVAARADAKRLDARSDGAGS